MRAFKCIKEIKGNDYYGGARKGKVYLTDNDENGLIDENGNYICEIESPMCRSDFEEVFPVDLSTVKVGEKYIIGEIGDCSHPMYDLYGSSLTDNEGEYLNYKTGYIVEIVEDCDSELCFSTDVNENCSHKIASMSMWGDLTLYPYTEPSEPSQEDFELFLGVTPENENVSTENEYKPSNPTDDELKYAKSYYNGYLRVAKPYINQFEHYSALVCNTEDEKKTLLIDNLGFTMDCVQDKICSILKINCDGEVLGILHESMMDFEDFGLVINRLKLEGILKGDD